MTSEIDNLTAIRTEATKHLLNGVTIADIVYRPFDMGVFGGEGYSLVLRKGSNRMTGVHFGKTPPTLEMVENQTKRLVDKLSI